jgi:uncharacterized membrane protein
MDWPYQFNINYQYTYGVTPLLFFLFLQNLSKLNRRHITKICVAAACFSVVLFASKNYNRIHTFHFLHENWGGDFAQARQMLEQIPPDASVSASTFIVPHLITRTNVFMVEERKNNYFDYDTEYLVLDMRMDPEIYRRIEREIARRQYEKVASGSLLEIFRNLNYSGTWQ